MTFFFLQIKKNYVFNKPIFTIAFKTDEQHLHYWKIILKPIICKAVYSKSILHQVEMNAMITFIR